MKIDDGSERMLGAAIKVYRSIVCSCVDTRSRSGRLDAVIVYIKQLYQRDVRLSFFILLIAVK